MRQQLVRFGSLGWLGLFRVDPGSRLAPQTRVVCSSPRGLEIGEVVSDELFEGAEPVVGRVLRNLSASDRLLWERLERHRDRALRSCEALLRARQITATLLDAELTFDGQQLFFYFLGDTPPGLEELTAELAELYQAKIHYQRFATTLEQGCGPGCGTVASGCGTAGSCGSGGCSGCPRAAAVPAGASAAEPALNEFNAPPAAGEN